MIETLGELIETLEALNPDLPLRGEWGFVSWRGSYYDLSLGYGGTNVGSGSRTERYPPTEIRDRPWLRDIEWEELDNPQDIPAAKTVGELLDVAREVDGGYLTGYKGGVFRMSRDTNLWADAYGECPGRRVAGVSLYRGSVIIARTEGDRR